MHRTPEEIRTIGLAALRDKLGQAGLIQFIQQFERGSGNWAAERQTWADQLSMDGLRKLVTKRRKPRNRRAS